MLIARLVLAFVPVICVVALFDNGTLHNIAWYPASLLCALPILLWRL